MEAEGIFNLIVLDDKLAYARDEVIEYARQKKFDKPFANSKAVDRIQDCLDLPLSSDWNGEWLFILDCDLTGKSEGEYGGFEAWSQLVARQPDGRSIFAMLYSQSLTKFIDAVEKGGDRAKLALSPQFYKRDKKESWWNSVSEWISRRQKDLISYADDINRRIEITNQLKDTVSQTPQEA
jgi:hypothetical protein